MRRIFLIFLLISIIGCSPTEYYYKCDDVPTDIRYTSGLFIDLNRKVVSYEHHGDGNFRDYQINENEKTYIKAIWYSEDTVSTEIIYDPPDSLNIKEFGSEPRIKQELTFNKLTNKVILRNYLLGRWDPQAEKTYKLNSKSSQICKNAELIRP